MQEISLHIQSMVNSAIELLYSLSKIEGMHSQRILHNSLQEFHKKKFTNVTTITQLHHTSQKQNYIHL